MPKEVLHEIVTRYRLRYKEATRKEKSKILNAFCETWDYSRKHAIKLMNDKPFAKKKKRGPRACA